jgi:hypothetical protein
MVCGKQRKDWGEQHDGTLGSEAYMQSDKISHVSYEKRICRRLERLDAMAHNWSRV